jgi:pimeloyl-ACP methyl ester carboxylesterase
VNRAQPRRAERKDVRMSRLPPPRFEGSIRLDGGRRLGFAEFGPAAGRPLVWLHGTPGARRQIAPDARELAHERDVRIVCVERPGIGESTPHLFAAVVDFAADVERLCDALGIGRFAVAGLSGGGPYALACAHEFPDRVVAAAILGGVAPAAGPDAVEGGAVGWTRLLSPVFERVHAPLGGVLRGVIRVLEPLADEVLGLFARMMPPGDQRIFEDAAMRRMFEEDLIQGSRSYMQAIWLDAVLFGRPWGFSLADLRVPVHLWYGDSDTIVPRRHGEHLAERIPGARLRIRAEEGHLGGLGASREIFDALLAHWPDAPPALSAAARPRARRSPAPRSGPATRSPGS